jgi:hypothetical protein
VDIEDPREINIYNLKGKSHSNSFQAEMNFEPIKKMEVRLAYRLFDVKMTYGNQLLQKNHLRRSTALLVISVMKSKDGNLTIRSTIMAQSELPTRLQIR